jgi:hypothetical protein
MSETRTFATTTTLRESDAPSGLLRFDHRLHHIGWAMLDDAFHRKNAGRLVMLMRPLSISQWSWSPGWRSSASRISFGTVVRPLVMMVEVGMVGFPLQKGTSA